MIQPLGWHTRFTDNKTLAVATAVSYLIVTAFGPRFPWGAGIYLVGLVFAATQTTVSIHHVFKLWQPQLVTNLGITELVSSLSAAAPQLPVATLNILSTSAALSTSLFPRFSTYPNSTSMGLSVAFFNLIGCWFGTMPMCYACCASAGEHYWSTASGASIVILGATILLLGLFFGDTLFLVLGCFPKSLLGIMLLVTGVNLASVGQHASDFAKAQFHMTGRRTGDGHNARDPNSAKGLRAEEERLIMLITATGYLAFQNHALGLVVGLCWYHGSALKRSLRRVERSGTDAVDR
jgi:MFS superfamily sulfate permease-like transporter